MRVTNTENGLVFTDTLIDGNDYALMIEIPSDGLSLKIFDMRLSQIMRAFQAKDNLLARSAAND